MKYINVELFFKGSVKDLRCAIGSKDTVVCLYHIRDLENLSTHWIFAKAEFLFMD